MVAMEERAEERDCIKSDQEQKSERRRCVVGRVVGKRFSDCSFVDRVKQRVNIRVNIRVDD